MIKTKKIVNSASSVARNIIKKLDKNILGEDGDDVLINKNIILFINTEKPEVTYQTIDSLKKYGKEINQKFRFAIIFDSKKTKQQDKELLESVDIAIPCNFTNSLKIEEALLPYKEELIAITSRSPESNIPIFAKIIPHVPYLKIPTAESLRWSINKIDMRQHLKLYDSTITPKFLVAKNSGKKILKQIKEDIGFPLIIKPAGLAQSLLVSICFHEEDLEDTLKKTFKKVKKIYKENNRITDPEILIEQFFEGDMYSVDAYVNAEGEITFCPLVHVITGHSIGFDDFFSYKAITPTTLTKEAIKEAESVAIKSVYAMGLRNSTVHIELIKTNEGWKIIELGPRMGGFRHLMYKLTFNIDHQLNDILIRIPKKVIIPKKCLGYAETMKFFAREEGVITEIKGIKKIQELKSFETIDIHKKVGDKCLYAKNGGKSVFDLTLFNKSRSSLLSDVRRTEQAIEIKIL